MRQSRTIFAASRRAAVLALLLCALALPAHAAAPGATLFGAQGSTPAIFAMGGRDESALAPRGGGEESVAEQIFAGSYLGALLFGYPATGFGGVDLVVLAVLAYLVLRSVGGRKGRDEDRFTVHRGGSDDNNTTDSEGTSLGDTYGRRDIPRERRDETPPAANHRDNAWSRKIRGAGTDPRDGEDPEGAPPRRNAGYDNPWARDTRGGQDDGREQKPRVTVRERAEAMWGHLGSEQSGQDERAPAGSVDEGARVPAGFDVNDFLDGARTLYIRLQNAWATRKVESLAPFVENGLMDTLRGQAEANPEPSPVNIMRVNATLQDVRGDSEDQRALVRFAVLLQTAGEARPSEVNEVWTFARNSASSGMWRLAGIEAV